jgi:hypothetical protein
MTPFTLKINLCISVIALLISSLTAQATPIDFDIAQSFDDGSTSNFSFTYDPQDYTLTNVSDIDIEDANGQIIVSLAGFGAFQSDDFGSSLLVFIFNSLTTHVEEALAYNGLTSSFDVASAYLLDNRDFSSKNWSKSVDDDSNQGGDITINGDPLGFPVEELPIASVPEPNIVVLLLAGLFGYSLTGHIKKTLSAKKRASLSTLTL